MSPEAPIKVVLRCFTSNGPSIPRFPLAAVLDNLLTNGLTPLSGDLWVIENGEYHLAGES